MKCTFISVVILIFISSGAFAQDSTRIETPVRKFMPVVQVFGIASYDIPDHYYRYWIDRAFMGFQYKFNEKWSTKVLIDRGSPTTVGLITVTDSAGTQHYVTNSAHEGAYYTMYLKLATVRWNLSDRFSLEGGVILQNHYIPQDRFWGLRYVTQTFADRYYGIPPTDLGFIGYYRISRILSVDAALTNGEGPRFNQDVFGKVKLAGGISIDPSEKIKFRIFYHRKSCGEPAAATEHFFSTFTGIHITQRFRMSLEYDAIENLYNTTDLNSSGYSVYGIHGIGKKMEIFGRFDRLLYNGPADPDNVIGNGMALISGISINPVKGLSFSLNYQYFTPDDPEYYSDNQVRLSMEVNPEF